MNMVEFRINGFVSGRGPPGRNDPADGSIVHMTRREVEERFERVRGILNNDIIREKRVLVEQAAYGRFAAMTYAGACQQLAEESGPGFLCDWGIKTDLVNSARLDRWDRMRFVGTLLRVRGMAKSLFSRPVEELALSREEWVMWLKRWLWDPELNPWNDQMVKKHVLVSVFQDDLQRPQDC